MYNVYIKRASEGKSMGNVQFKNYIYMYISTLKNEDIVYCYIEYIAKI